MNLHNCLRDIRLEQGLTQEALADAVRVTRQTIISIEKGRFGPSTELALKIVAVLGVKVEDVFWLAQEGEKR